MKHMQDLSYTYLDSMQDASLDHGNVLCTCINVWRNLPICRSLDVVGEDRSNKTMREDQEYLISARVRLNYDSVA